MVSLMTNYIDINLLAVYRGLLMAELGNKTVQYDIVTLNGYGITYKPILV